MSLVSKRWPAESFAAIADRLTEHGFRVLLVGGPSDRGTADIVLALARPGIVYLVGKNDLGGLAAVFKHCRLVVANDTGPMHLAVGVGAPVVAIFGPSDPAVYGPYGQSEGVVTNESQCSPCFIGGRSPACLDHHCMTQLSAEKVWSVIEKRLEAAQPLPNQQLP
jgi:ADP-heptose:LPS heptosyltransferase